MRSPVVRCAALAAVVVIASSTPAVAGPSEDLPSPLGLEAVLARVRERSPRVVVRRKQAEAARLRPEAAPWPADPMAELSWWQQPVDFSRVPIMISLRQTLPWRSRLRAETELGRKEAVLLEEEASATEWESIAEAKRAYFSLTFAERSLTLNQRLRTLAEQLVSTADAQYRVGRANQADVLAAQGELLVLTNELLDLEQARAEASARLNQLLDRDPTAPLPPTAHLADPDPTDGSPDRSLEALTARALELRPALRQARAAIAAAEDRVRLARLTSLPELGLSAGYMANFRGMDMFTVSFSSTLPIFSSRKRRSLEATASAEVAAARSELQALERETRAAVQMTLLRTEMTRRHVRLHAEKMVPLAELTLESAQAAYMAGRSDFATLLGAARAVRMHHLDHIRFLIDYQRQLADLAELAGQGATP